MPKKKIFSVQEEKNSPEKPDKILRRQAEKKINEKKVVLKNNNARLLPVDIEIQLHELKVHQVELEIQNEELRRTEAELDASRLRYFDLYNLAPVAYLTLNEKSKILEANLQAAKLLGIEREKLLNQYFSNFILEEDLNIYYQGRKQLINTLMPLYYEIRMIKKTGYQFWANLELTVVKEQDNNLSFRIVIFDISESKKNVENERKIFLNLSIDLIAISDKNGYFKEINQALEKTSGFNREELLSRPVIEFIHPDDIKVSLEAIEKLKKGFPTVSFTSRFRCSNNRYKWLEWSMTAIGDLRYLISRDITERVEAEENMMINLEKEREINQLKSKFVSMVSHQFKTPLTVIQSNFDLLNMYEGMINHSFRDKFEIISYRVIKETKKLNALLNDILNLEVINSGKPRINLQDIDLISIIKEVIVEINSIQNDGRFVEQVFPVNYKKVYTDPKLFSYILINILTNAFKFSKGRKNPIITLVLTDEKIILEIKDFGIGIPAEELKEISSSFFRAKNAENIEGTGLGLNIAKEYLELINGSLFIESVEKKFTTVKIILPSKLSS